MHPSKDSLEQLQKRVREATGPDRELDAWIIVMLTPTKVTDDDLVYLIKTEPEDHCAPGTYWLKQRSGASLRTAPLLTTDLGACVALMRSLLPGWRREVFERWNVDDLANGPPPIGECSVSLEPFYSGAPVIKETHALETHALLLAIISAKLSLSKEKEAV